MITITIITIMITITIINPVESNIPFLCPLEKNGLKWVKLGNTSMCKLRKMITDNWLKIYNKANIMLIHKNSKQFYDAV